MTGLRILQVVQAPQRRGAEVFAALLGRELRQAGHEVRSAYLYPAADSGALAPGPDDIELGGDPGHPFERVPAVHPGLLRRLRRVIADYRPDVVQLNGARTVKYGAFSGARRRARPVLVYRGIGSPKRWVRGRLRREFYRRLVMPRMDGVVALSRSTLVELDEIYRLSRPAVVIPNAASAEAAGRDRRATRAEAATAPEAPVLLYVGSFSPEKRLDRWLRVARSLRRELPDLVLWLVGDGVERERIAELALALGLDGALRLIGSRDDVADFLAAADLFLLTSDTEGMPAVVLEAGMHALPVVAPRVGGLAECVVHGETGYLVDPTDEEGCVAVAAALLGDPAHRSRIGAAARSWCRERFSIESIAPRYLEFYRRLLQGGRSTGARAG